ncbi:MAG TPA: hypothetical protein VGG81_04710 [Edaphobacter sp.]|jgi:DNA-binding response OmpR family regulator
MGTILAVGQDQGLLATRAAILRRCNAGVVEARPSEAMKILRAQRFDLVVLCHTLSAEEMTELVGLAHLQANHSQVLEVLKATEAAWDHLPSGADDMALSQPETLIAKVTEMLSVPAHRVKPKRLRLLDYVSS